MTAFPRPDASGVRAALIWLVCHAGRRGVFLAFLATLDIAYGFSLFVTDPPLRAYDLMLPWEAWGIIWMAVGAVCASGIFVVWDRIQFSVAAALKATWSLLFVRVWLVDGIPRGWVSVVVWATFALTILVVAGWPEPPRRVMCLPDEERKK